MIDRQILPSETEIASWTSMQQLKNTVQSWPETVNIYHEEEKNSIDTKQQKVLKTLA